MYLYHVEIRGNSTYIVADSMAAIYDKYKSKNIVAITLICKIEILTMKRTNICPCSLYVPALSRFIPCKNQEYHDGPCDFGVPQGKPPSGA